MNKQQCKELYDRVAANWNLTPHDYTATIKTWWHYLSDLDHQQVSKLVDTKALTGGPPPRPAELRTQTLHPDLPTPQEALKQARELLDAIRLGTTIPQVHPTINRTVAAIGSPKDDWDFKQEYKKQTENYLRQHTPNATEPHTTNTSQTTDTNDA